MMFPKIPLMLISTGKVPSREPWRILEVAMNQAPDVLALRIAKELKRFHEPAEALIPFTPNAAGTMEWVVEHVYVRGLNGSLSRLAATPGIDFIRKETAQPEWIAQLKQHDVASTSVINAGDFVRLLTGPCARLCGHVTLVRPDHVTVSIALRTKRMTVHIQPENVQPVECPAEAQSFFYQPELSS